MTTRSLHLAIVLLSAAVAMLSISVVRIASEKPEVRRESAGPRHHVQHRALAAR
jgi:hypothetical protein